jgi:osmotically-inducible protein OsmY
VWLQVANCGLEVARRRARNARSPHRIRQIQIDRSNHCPRTDTKRRHAMPLKSSILAHVRGERTSRRKTVMDILRAIPVLVLMSAAPLTIACSPADQPDVEARVKHELKAAQLDGKVKVDWKQDEQAVHLSGKVDSAAEKTRAEELAQKAVGTSGRVVNEVAIDNVDMGEVDDRIEEHLGRMFDDRAEWGFDGKGVSFDSKEGVVTITGHVESPAIKARIAERARAIPDVRDVVDKLTAEAPNKNAKPDRK